MILEMEDGPTRLTFLRFALQCCDSPMNRNYISKDEENNAMAKVSKGELPPLGLERKFREAYILCSMLAGELGKERIDTDVVLRYFLFQHNPNLDRDLAAGVAVLDRIDCRTYPGQITRIEGRFAMVKTPLEELRCKRDFAPGLGVGALVAVHRGMIAMQINQETFNLMASSLKNKAPLKLKG
jgi:hypothetical protein